MEDTISTLKLKWFELDETDTEAKQLRTHVPKSIFEEESARREEELKIKVEKARAKARVEAEDFERRMKEARQELIASLIEKFPHVPEHQLEKLVDTGNKILSPEETGYQFGVGTRAYWQQLGFAREG